MPITPLPTPPSRADSANFASRADSFLAALPTFATEANTTATEVNNNALTASSAATTASQAAVNVAMAGASITGTSTSSVVIGTGSKSLTIEAGKSFVAGMPVRIGDTAAPNTNFMDGNVTSYNSGTGALVVSVTGTQGSGTFTSWSVRAVASSNNTGSETQTTTVTLTPASRCVQVLNMPAFGHSVQLPSATTLSRGPDLFILDNSWGRFPVGVLDGSGRVLGAVLPGDAVDFDLIDNTTTAGSWRHRGNLDPVWINSDTGLNLTLNPSTPAYFSIDGTRGLITYSNASGLPCARLITYSGSGSPTISAELVLTALSGSVQGVWLMGSTNRILVRLPSNSVVIVDISNSSTPTVGSSASVTFTSGSLNNIVVLDNQYAVGWANDASNSVVRARCIDCGASGTTVTVGTEVATSAISAFSNVWTTKTASATAVGFIVNTFNGSTTSLAVFTLTRTSGTTLFWSTNIGAPTGVRTDINDGNWRQFDLSADRLLFCYRANGGGPRYVVITFTTTPTYGTVASGNISGFDGSLNVSTSPDRTRFVSSYSSVSGASHRQCEAFTVSGTTVTVGSATNFTADTSIYNASIVEMSVDNNGRGFVSWTSTYASSINNRDKWRTFTLSGTTFTFSTEVGSAPGFPNMQNVNRFEIASIQGSLGSGFFRLSANRFTGTFSESRTIVFTVNSDTSINVIASVDCSDSSFSVSGIQGISDRGLFMQTYSTEGYPGTEAIVLFTSGGFKRGRHLTGFTNLSFTNGQSAPNQRNLLVGVGYPDAQFGRNITINTYRIAEA